MVATIQSARDQVLPLLIQDLEVYGREAVLEPVSPDGDVGKFLLNGKIARVIYRRDGFYVKKINLDWFSGIFPPPIINRTPFYWYVFALAPGHMSHAISYFVCSYHQLIQLVLDFDSPAGIDHRDHNMWNGRFIFADENKSLGYFAWRDEIPLDAKPNRIFRLRNVDAVFSGPDGLDIDPSISADLLVHKHTYDQLPATEREAIVKSRIGQGVFRTDLLDYWPGCSVTGVSERSLLTASHIKPWRDSTNLERLDPFNGLLLTPNLDRMFDRGLISFSNKGKIKISSQTRNLDLLKLGIREDMRLSRVDAAHLTYLSYHQEKLFID